ncbi:hypothetical protein HOU03_gp330 [Caulobacter phage CcrSC]|uniref:Uncharacterized protein n=1 Tax=Caulobacter phage CcrSC TaxID=2283272 RepID=A0A385EGC3_9CAUD|nr:hypothetical protein HOU03_gp330 [Caulobacter phage CcrSC]AXQ69938.1 hypothetical protein CcrSC_gp356 [Caulobacter phage CcrSC]
MRTAEEIKELPRLEPRYGGTFVLLNDERMLIRRDVPDFQMGGEMKQLASQGRAILVFKEVHHDCRHCRARREAFAREHPNLTRPTLIERLRAAKDRDAYWCNTCQATGWVVEPIEDLIKRLDIVTWEKKAAALSNEELKVEMAQASDLNFRLHKKGFPPDVLAAEAARRL